MSTKKIKGQPAVKTPPAPVRATHPAGPAGLKPWQADLIACIVIFLAVFVMFHEIPLQGRVFSRGDDTEASASWDAFARHEAEVREYPLWCPYVFGGFPGLAAGAYSNYEYMGFPYSLANRVLSPRYWATFITDKLLFLGVIRSSGSGDDYAANEQRTARWLVSLFLYAGLLTYLLMRRLGFRPLISVLPALAMAWNPYLVSLATAAHGGKLMTFIYMPLIVLLAWNVFDKRRVLDFALLAVAFGWQIAVGGHTQILFYSLVTVAILYVVWAVFEIREHGAAGIVKPALFAVGAVILGFAVGALWYIPLLEYVGYSIRGMGPAIAQEGTQAGYSMAEATQWSFHPQEILTFIVPSWFGLKSPYYWGTMPFTSSSFYFGVVPLLFAVLAFFGRKDRLFWGLLAVTVFSLLLSFGQHFQSFYGLFFNLLPFFNKFRTPSLILLLAVLAGVIWAGYGLRFVLKLPDSDKWRKGFLYGAIACAVLLAVALLAGDALSGLFGSFTRAGEAQQYSPEQLTQVRAMRFNMLHKDLLLALTWLAMAFTACWAYAAGKLKATAFLIVIVAITAIDLWRFSHQFFDPQPANSTLETLRPNNVVRELQKDTGLYRVMPLGQLQQDNRWAAWEIASLGGYHGAKLRSYQDLMEFVLPASPDRRAPINMGFLSAMNCKYLIAQGQLPPQLNLETVTVDQAEQWVLYRNPRALERVYFADSILVEGDRAETVRRLADPAFLWNYMALVDRPLPGPVEYHPDRSAEITAYTPHLVRIQARVAAPSLMVMSDAYYEPGWSVLDNGSEVSVYKVNGFVRGLYLRPGQHTIEFRYEGKYEKTGVTVATVSHFLVWGLVIGALWYELRRRKERT